jgi:hypothetical protein
LPSSGCESHPMGWRSDPLQAKQRVLVQEALEYIARHQAGLPERLLDRLHQLLQGEAIRTRSLRGARARYLALPFLAPWIELDPSALGLETLYEWRAALSACFEEGEAGERRRALIRARAEQSWLFVAAALVHEGAHAVSGLSLSRLADERLAYEAERRFLGNVLARDPAPLVANAARSLLSDADRDAWTEEGLRH